MVGDVVINRDSGDPYTFYNFITKTSSVERFNKRGYDTTSLFEVLIERHQRNELDLHYVDFQGNSQKVSYKTIGSGRETADMFCKTLPLDTITMKDFTKHAYLAIMFMNQYCPGLGVGVEPDGIPDISYLDYNEEWDCEPPKEDKEYFKKYSDEKLEEFKHLSSSLWT